MKRPHTIHSDLPARQCPVVAEAPPISMGRYDYADAFEATLNEGDDRTAEQVFRELLRQLPSALGVMVVLAHRHVLRLRLGPVSSPKHLVGWQVMASEPEMLHLEASGPLIAGAMVARRVGTNTARLTTFVSYQRPAAGIVWAIVGPVHRRVALYLMQRAAVRPAESA